MQNNGLTDGWVKLYRKIIDSQVFQSEGLLKANHEDQWIQVKTGKGTTQVFVKRGQFIFGRKTAAKELKMVERTVHKRMLKLETMQNCDIQSDTHYSTVTILNYDVYQSRKINEVTGKVTGKGQASDTNKNDKNEKNLKNIECNDFERLEAFLSSLPEYQFFSPEARDLILEFINKVREANKTKTIQGGRVFGLLGRFRGIQDRADQESLLVGLKKVFRKNETDGFDFIQ